MAVRAVDGRVGRILPKFQVPTAGLLTNPVLAFAKKRKKRRHLFRLKGHAYNANKHWNEWVSYLCDEKYSINNYNKINYRSILVVNVC